ncbi:MAG: hypothetical protein IIX00_07205, partial [Tidjanibacter sp.]|nr:hypothetical protein [Tidjanibacter sp.]
MKKGVFILIVALLGTVAQMSGAKVYRADSKEIRWVGRVDVAPEGEVRFDWSGTYAEMIFCGSKLEMEVSDSGKNYFNVIVDGC